MGESARYRQAIASRNILRRVQIHRLADSIRAPNLPLPSRSASPTAPYTPRSRPGRTPTAYRGLGPSYAVLPAFPPSFRPSRARREIV